MAHKPTMPVHPRHIELRERGYRFTTNVIKMNAETYRDKTLALGGVEVEICEFPFNVTPSEAPYLRSIWIRKRQ